MFPLPEVVSEALRMIVAVGVVDIRCNRYAARCLVEGEGACKICRDVTVCLCSWSLEVDVAAGGEGKVINALMSPGTTGASSNGEGDGESADRAISCSEDQSIYDEGVSNGS